MPPHLWTPGRDPLLDLDSPVPVEPYEAFLVQLLPQRHLHPQVVVDEEAHRAVAFVVVVVRVLPVVRRHEAVRAHLRE